MVFDRVMRGRVFFFSPFSFHLYLPCAPPTVRCWVTRSWYVFSSSGGTVPTGMTACWVGGRDEGDEKDDEH